MTDAFFAKPILNSPYRYPARHWELDPLGQPTQQIIEKRRGAQFISRSRSAEAQLGGALDGPNAPVLAQ